MSIFSEDENTVFDFLKTLYLRPTSFFKENISNVRPKYFKLALAVYFIGFGINFIENGLATTPVDKYPLLNTWIGFWIGVPFLGVIFGYLAFSLLAWFYHIRVKWSGGTTSINKSRYIFLYSSVIYYLYAIFFALFRTVTDSNPLQQDDFSNILVHIFAILYFVALLYSVHVSYRGVMAITNVEKNKARFWFYILPMAFYLVFLII